MKFTYNQYNHESGYHRIPSKIHNFSHQHYKNGAMRMTMATSSTMTSRIYRKGFRIPSKKHPGKALPGKLHSLQRIGPGKITPGKRIPPRPYPPPCDNSNDSGLGFDQHIELQPQSSIAPRSLISSKSTLFNHDDDIPINSNDLFLSSPKSGISISSSSSSPQSSTLLSSSPNGRGQYSNLLQVNNRTKRRKVDSLVEINEDACSEDIFIQKIASSSALTAQSKVVSNVPRQVRAALKRQPAQSQNNIVTSSNGQVQLEIVSQPEQQHRARYQTEGSRGAVKDRSGNGFPIVRLVGYNKPAVLQVFIGTDVGKVAPHMFYQACKVSGKNSTPCNEKKVEGTMFIEIEFKPENDMTITCDCVGILKERNVDVEHRFPDHLAQKSKKKSTRCRMVFRTQLTNDEGSHLETLQACSNAIICTQPPGVPEVCKKSLESSPVEGGLELFIIGKNFLKDTFVVFKESVDPPQASLSNPWEMKVVPDKEYLQQTHLICVVPSYYNQTINKPVKVELFIISSGKKSETHSFMYTPSGTHTILSAASSTMSLHGVLSATKAI
ncbi:NFAT5.2 family protein [Megaselia abdita]